MDGNDGDEECGRKVWLVVGIEEELYEDCMNVDVPLLIGVVGVRNVD